ncbi:MAG TPA: hypothetical protein VG755_07940, partial [Nannocystaceae bacterium]|nr:hypothetical protein [Nannocystaceae bacterium]
MAPEWTTDPLGSVALREHRAAADPRVLIYDDAPTPAGTIELTFEQMFAAVLHHLQAMSPTNRHAVLQALHAVSVTQLLAEREPQSYGLEPQGRCEHWYSWLPPRVLGLVSARLKGKGASKLAALCETRHRHRARGQGRRIDRAKKKTSGNAWAMGERMVKTATTVGLVIERGDGLNCPEFSGGSRSWETPSNGKEEQVLSGDPGAS